MGKKHFEDTSRVSIIMPAFNCQKYIAKAIESVLFQSFGDFELIIINDGSTDSTLPIIKSFASRDSRIVVIDQQNSGKPSIARNAGLKHAKGEYLCFLDADDFYHPDKIKLSLELLDKNPDVAAVFTDMKLMAEDGTEHDGSFLGDRDFKRLASEYLTYAGENTFFCSERFYCFMSTHFNTITTNTIMIRRSVLDREGLMFPTDVVVGEDTEMWFRLAKGRKIGFLDEVLCCYRQHETSVTQNCEKWYSDSLIVLTRNFKWGQDVFTADDVYAYKKRLAGAYFHKGYYYKSEFKQAEARKAYVKSLRWFFSLKTLSALLKTFVPLVVVKSLKGNK